MGISRPYLLIAAHNMRSTSNLCEQMAQKRSATSLTLTPVTPAPRSVMFNFLGRDFFNALAEKDADRFAGMIVKWLCALCVGIPVFVFRDYYQARIVGLDSGSACGPRMFGNAACGKPLASVRTASCEEECWNAASRHRATTLE